MRCECGPRCTAGGTPVPGDGMRRIRQSSKFPPNRRQYTTGVMRRITALLVFAAFAATAADTDFNGRWNIKPHDKNRNRAWWLEVTGAGTPELKGRFVGAPGGGMDVIPEISIRGGELT